MSVGRTGPPGCGADVNLNGCAPVVEDAMRYAVCAGAKSSTCSGAGAFIAVSAGNDFLNGNPVEVYAEIASRVSGAVSVAAVSRAKGHASYSSTGSYIELAAPGGDGGRCSTSSDTSFILQQTLSIRWSDLHAAGVPVRAAELRQQLLLRRRRRKPRAHRRRGRDADAAGHHRPCGG